MSTFLKIGGGFVVGSVVGFGMGVVVAVVAIGNDPSIVEAAREGWEEGVEEAAAEANKDD